MPAMTPADVDLLTSPAGRELLAALPPYAADDALRLGESLRAQGHDPDLIALALTQSRLRAKAVDKLGPRGTTLLLTADGLEQATRAVLAARHAARYVAAGVEQVLDLGCGLGLDALAFADAGLDVVAVEADAATAALATHNLGVHAGVRVVTGTAEHVLAGALEPQRLVSGPRRGVWFDPARRTPGRTDATGRTRRVFSLDAMSPPWEFVLETAAAVPATGAKLSPGFPHARVPDGAEAEWVSFAGEVLECAVWWGPLATSPGRSATVIGRDGVTHRVVADDGRDASEVLQGARRDVDAAGGIGPDAGSFLYDPDRAVVRAGLVGALAAATGGRELGPDAGYVVSGQRVEVPWARRFVVLDTLPATTKAVRSWARAHRVGRLTLKKRGSALDPDRFRRGLKLGGAGGEGIVVLTSDAGRQIAIAVAPD